MLAIGGINTARVGEVIAAGCAGVAVMGGVMRAADPARETAALVATLDGVRVSRGPGRCLMPCSGAHTPDGSFPACQNTSIGMPPRG